MKEKEREQKKTIKKKRKRKIKRKRKRKIQQKKKKGRRVGGFRAAFPLFTRGPVASSLTEN